MMMAERKEIKPPWVEYPGIGPADGIWRQGVGESFLSDAWEPYYKSLSEPEQEAYLQRWNVPDEWKSFYFDKEWQAFLESADEDPVPIPPSDTESIGIGYGPNKYLHLLKQFLHIGKRK
ncbi:MAG: hypothetical protein ACRYFU_16685, partial [Janthinobacterium lividum]